jgi:hypothetical protein
VLKPVKSKGLESIAEERGLVFLEIAKHQEEYLTLPAYYSPATGAVLTEWELDEETLRQIRNGANIRLAIWTGGKSLQPVFLTTSVGYGELEEVRAMPREPEREVGRNLERRRVQADVGGYDTQDIRPDNTASREEATEPEERAEKDRQTPPDDGKR